MQIATETLSAEAAYKLVTGVVVPRPIAWITTLNKEGGVNLAPFSAFNFVSTYPPLLGINFGRRGGKTKNTADNIHRTGEFVVNIGDETMIEAIHRSSAEYPPDVSEADMLGLETISSQLVKAPRLAITPVGMECRFQQALKFKGDSAEFVIGEILMFHVRDDIISDGKVDTAKLRPACRIGGPNYAGLGEIARMARAAGTPESP